MNILITGADGQLGSQIGEILEQGETELGLIPPLYNSCTIVSTDINTLDISDFSAVEHFFHKHSIHLVFNCAAMTNVDGNLAMVCNASGARLIHVSSDYVFDGISNAPYTEQDIPDPATVYGQSKHKGEKEVLKHCTNSCICRTSWLYGKKGQNFVRTMVRLGLEKESVTVVNDQIGNPTNALDLAYQMILLAAAEETGVFHCTGNGPEVSWYGFTKEIFQIAGIQTPVIPCSSSEFPRSARRPEYSVLDNRRLRETIGDSMRNWKTALRSFMEQQYE